MEIFRHDNIDSTSSECFRKFDRGDILPFAVIAKTQAQGRGQFGRTWYSADGQNLYVSFGFVPRQTPQQFQNFSTIVAENLVECLANKLNMALQVKPPNDIYCAGKKVCGILTESRILHGRIIFAVTGIGLNVAGDLSKFPKELRSKATTLGEHCKKIISPAEIEAYVLLLMQQLMEKYKFLEKI
ncbi:MAG: biotin--[acetyl-CoA-carboxylase] ligase [Puniceicoccales bacterium]|jgi:BirA family biotin operon repressor/biotin-[acetyl-CoA-carboxylase] ligase|nr:biotin--[acetyl-CoA-carboxylase] ligase [Puniceicoccales bacterium]